MESQNYYRLPSDSNDQVALKPKSGLWNPEKPSSNQAWFCSRVAYSWVSTLLSSPLPVLGIATCVDISCVVVAPADAPTVDISVPSLNCWRPGSSSEGAAGSMVELVPDGPAWRPWMEEEGPSAVGDEPVGKGETGISVSDDADGL